MLPFKIRPRGARLPPLLRPPAPLRDALRVLLLWALLWHGFVWTVGTPYLRTHYQAYQTGRSRTIIAATYYTVGHRYQTGLGDRDTFPLILIRPPEPPLPKRLQDAWQWLLAHLPDTPD